MTYLNHKNQETKSNRKLMFFVGEKFYYFDINIHVNEVKDIRMAMHINNHIHNYLTHRASEGKTVEFFKNWLDTLIDYADNGDKHVAKQYDHITYEYGHIARRHGLQIWRANFEFSCYMYQLNSLGACFTTKKENNNG